MTNTIPNVPRELLADLLGNDHDKRIMAERHLLAMLANAPSPAGVDGLEVVSNWVLFDAEADKPYIKKMLPEGFLAFFDCEEDARRAKANNPGTDYKRIDRVKAEDAQAIIDGLRGEVERSQRFAAGHVLTNERISANLHAVESERDQQAQRICELEGLLQEAYKYPLNHACETVDFTAQDLCERIDAALSAGKEGAQ